MKHKCFRSQIGTNRVNGHTSFKVVHTTEHQIHRFAIDPSFPTTINRQWMIWAAQAIYWWLVIHWRQLLTRAVRYLMYQWKEVGWRNSLNPSEEMIEIVQCGDVVVVYFNLYIGVDIPENKRHSVYVVILWRLVRRRLTLECVWPHQPCWIRLDVAGRTVGSYWPTPLCRSRRGSAEGRKNWRDERRKRH